MTVRIWGGWGNEWRYQGQRTNLQQKRYEALVHDGLKPYQARHFIFYGFSSAYFRRFRSAIRRGEAGRSQSSVWALWRRIFNDAIAKGRRGDRGGYVPPKKPYDPNKPHKKLNPDGSIDYSHSSAYERNRRAKTKGKTASAPKPLKYIDGWIQQLQMQIQATNDQQRKAQLQAQIDRLRRFQR